MVAQDPQVARLRDGLVGGIGDVVRIRVAVPCFFAEESCEIVCRESEQVQVDLQFLQRLQLVDQQPVVPVSQFAQTVVGDPERPDLLRRQPTRDVDRDRLQTQLQRGLPASVSGDNDTLRVDDDRLPKPEILDRAGDLVDRLIVPTGVTVIRDDLGDFPDLRSAWGLLWGY